MNQADTQHYQSCCMIIADEIDRICKKHDIKYSLAYGSFIGAVRHKGFIPWDDDMDVTMLRDDYEKFVAICKNELGDKFHLVNWDTDENYPLYFSKITLANTYIKEEFAPDNIKYPEIFVDVFPYDKVPFGKKVQRRTLNKADFLNKMLWMKKGYGECIKKQNAKSKIKFYIFKLFCSFVPYNIVKNARKKHYIKFNNLPLNKCALYSFECDRYDYAHLTYNDTFSDMAYYDFGGRKYMGFADSDKYLSYMYKDYMTLPAEDKRVNHSITKIDFGEY